MDTKPNMWGHPGSNSTEIYIIDSCMTGIVLPLLKTGHLKARVVRIILRKYSNIGV